VSEMVNSSRNKFEIASFSSAAHGNPTAPGSEAMDRMSATGSRGME